MEIVIEAKKCAKPLHECESGFYLREDDQKVIFNVFKVNGDKYYQVINNSDTNYVNPMARKLASSGTTTVIPLTLEKIVFTY